MGSTGEFAIEKLSTLNLNRLSTSAPLSGTRRLSDNNEEMEEDDPEDLYAEAMERFAQDKRDQEAAEAAELKHLGTLKRKRDDAKKARIPRDRKVLEDNIATVLESTFNAINGSYKSTKEYLEITARPDHDLQTTVKNDASILHQKGENEKGKQLIIAGIRKFYSSYSSRKGREDNRKKKVSREAATSELRKKKKMKRAEESREHARLIDSIYQDW